jgi:hypothetical protein
MQNQNRLRLALVGMLAATAFSAVPAFAQGDGQAGSGGPAGVVVAAGPTAVATGRSEPPSVRASATPTAEPVATTEGSEPAPARTAETTPGADGTPVAATGPVTPTGTDRAAPQRVSAAAACTPADRSDSIDSLELVTVDGSPTLEAWESVRLQFAGSLPDGGCAGDTVTISIPNSLGTVSGVFPVLAADGTQMGTMVVSGGKAVITFNDYVETHDQITFEGFLGLHVTNRLEPGRDYVLEFPVGSEVIQVPVTTGECPGCADEPTRAGKWASMQLGDPKYVAFGIVTEVSQGAGEQIVITDTLGPGQEFDCSSLVVRMGNSRDAWGAVIWSQWVTGRATITCDPASAVATVSIAATAAGEYYTLEGHATVTEVRDSYTDNARVVQSGVTHEVSAEAGVRSGGVIGDGSGRVPHIDIEKWSTDQGPVDGDHDDAPGKALDPAAAEQISFTITNDGREDLVDVVVADRTSGGIGVIEGLSCDFSPLGGPATGVEWAGPFVVGATFTCTGTLPPLGAAASHADLASVDAIGVQTRQPVEDEDSWHGTTPEQQTPTPTPTPTETEVEVQQPSSSSGSDDQELAYTGAGSVPLAAGLLGGVLLIVGLGLIRLRGRRN